MKNVYKAVWYFRYIEKKELWTFILFNLIGIAIIAINSAIQSIFAVDTTYNIYISMISIFIGFNVTFLSIMTLSNYSKKLYSIEITTNGGITTNMLSQMIMYYKGQIYYSFVLLLVFIIANHLNFQGDIWVNLFILLSINWFIVTTITLKYTFAFIIRSVKFQ